MFFYTGSVLVFAATQGNACLLIVPMHCFQPIIMENRFKKIYPLLADASFLFSLMIPNYVA